MNRIGGVATIALLISAPAMARPIYFHKAGVEHASYIADVGECRELAGGVRTPAQYHPYSPNLAAAAASSFFAGFFGAREQRGIVENVLRTCMTDKGYRRVEVTAQIKKELDDMEESMRVERLFALAASENPAGTVLPQ